MEIILVRHGENKANITKEYSYKIVDYSLTAKGVRQAIQVAHCLQQYCIDQLLSSPLLRAKETAAYIASAVNVNVAIEEDLREINVGHLDGLVANEENRQRFFAVINEWNQGNLEKRFPGGESGRELRDRFCRVVQKVATEHDGIVVLVGHAGIFTNGVMALCQITDFTRLTARYDNCSISKIAVDQSVEGHRYRLVSWNDTNHLLDEPES
ncbi:MAG: histidine phosphatase family protein [Caldilineaceae bacterium]